jgi:DNA-directed RNA polymerase specialized sigma24 family protein
MPNLTTEIAKLWKQGLSAREIADRMDIPYEQVAEAMGVATDAAQGDLDGRDRTVADSFPASDAPPGPAV